MPHSNSWRIESDRQNRTNTGISGENNAFYIKIIKYRHTKVNYGTVNNLNTHFCHIYMDIKGPMPPSDNFSHL